MNWFQVVSIFLVILMTVTLSSTDDSSSDDQEERRDCGQYGFRCLNEKTLEFCPIVVDGVTERSEIYECDDDFTCDEDNPAYCTPKEPPNKLIQDIAKEEPPHGGVRFQDDVNDDVVYFDEDSYYRLERVARSNKEDGCGCEETTTTTTEEPTTTTESDADFTTETYTPAPPFECDSYGFFADKKNSTLFWYCDVPLNGVGFLLRHMMCGHGRHFDEMLKNCILQGTIRQERKDEFDKCMDTRTTKTVLDCMNKKPGKYPDETNCRVYHLCLPKQFSPAIQLTFSCPRGTAYDATCRSCTVAAYNRCQAKGQPPNKSKINCRSPTRFRSTEDCSSYFLCFVDNVIEIKCPKFYKFDDFSLECLPEKVAECKEYSV